MINEGIIIHVNCWVLTSCFSQFRAFLIHFILDVLSQFCIKLTGWLSVLPSLKISSGLSSNPSYFKLLSGTLGLVIFDNADRHVTGHCKTNKDAFKLSHSPPCTLTHKHKVYWFTQKKTWNMSTLITPRSLTTSRNWLTVAGNLQNPPFTPIQILVENSQKT